MLENGTSWSAGHATRVPAIVSAVDAKGTISINSNRTTYKDGWLRQQSLSGTIRAESVKPGEPIASDDVASLKLATIETHTLQLPDHPPYRLNFLALPA